MANVPTGLNGVVTIAAGAYQNLAVQSDGTAVEWGIGDGIPRGLKGVFGIAAGSIHNLALIPATPQLFMLTAPQRMVDGAFGCMLSGEAGRNYTVQSSTDLTNWTDLQTVVPIGGGAVQIIHTNASTYPQHFYRARIQ